MLDPTMGIPRDILFTRHEGRRGFEWLALSYRMFRAASIRWLSMVMLYWIVLILCRALPFIGGLAPFIVKPLFSVGFLAGAWRQERGEAPKPADLFQGFRANLWALLPLGIFLVVGSGLAVAATALVDHGRLLDLLFDPPPPDLDSEAATKRVSDVLSDPQVRLGMIFAALCTIPTILAMWWAPALVVFQDAGLITALRVSFKAALANWRAILRYCVSVFFFLSILPSLVILVVSVIVPESLFPYVATAIFVPYGLCLLAILQISDYISYRDVFHAGETLAPVERRRSAA
jgi:hypothetical protein